MAEMLVSAFLSVLFERLASRPVLDFFQTKKLDENLFMRLKISLMMVSVVIDDAEAKEVTHPTVKQWLEELKDATYHAEDVLDEIVTLASIPKKSIFNTVSKLQFGNKKIDVKRVEDIVFRMELLASKKELLGLHERDIDNSMQGETTTSLLVESSIYGRDDDKKHIVESVLMDVAPEDQIPVITIVGMGGIGKTTLAKTVYNDPRVHAYFHVKAWVCVADEEFDVFRITKTILQTITSSNHSSDITELNLLQLKLKEMLTGKIVLLALDDVWDVDYSKWRMLCAPFMSVSPGSKIIVTTRNDGVASIMRTRTNPSHSLKHLSDEDGWRLFADHAFGTAKGDSYQHLQVIGKQIVEKCKGLPLAIKSLSGVLRNKDDVKVWENVAKSELWDLPIGKTSILPALRLSYHYLPTRLKRCFAYCSIFPQDYEFEKEKLVLLWMAEGFLIDSTDKSMQELGEEYFDELFSRSFFQIQRSYRTYHVMHDLNHDLAAYVSGKFCVNLEKSKTSQLPEKVRHVYYSQGEYDVYHKFGPVLDAKYLRTVLLLGPHYQKLPLTNTVVRDLFSRLSCIRVLSLSSYSSIKLPDSIGTLIHLRYLDLSRTDIQTLPDKICQLFNLQYLNLSGTDIQTLPEKICQLYNLQTLSLSYCLRLIKLPAAFGELVNLVHLDIERTLIDKLPLWMRKLESLQTLSSFIVGEGNCSGLGELNGLRHLKGSLSITGLDKVKNVEDAIEANLMGKIGINNLSFEWGGGEIGVSNNHSVILDKLQPSPKLHRLTLVNYGGTRLSNWLGDGSVLSNLTHLKISNCVHCVSLPSLGQLPSLVELHFEKLVSVKRVDSDFYGKGSSSRKPFQKLQILWFERMLEWEEWSPSGDGDNDDFPKLEKLCIRDCPKLSGNLPKLLPSLDDLKISECGKLNAAVPGDASPRSLGLEGCENIIFENMRSLNLLTSLKIGGLESNSFPVGMMESCNNVEELTIRNWNSLTHLPEGGLPTSLRKLEIQGCRNLKEFLSQETFHNYKHLEDLYLHSSCVSMTCFPLGLFPNLKNLNIHFLRNLESLSIEDEEENHENLKSLRDLFILGCDELIKFPSGGLRTPNLNFLCVCDCKNLKWLPEGMNTQLTSLQTLFVWKSEQVESFPAGGLPSSLRNLLINDCKKLMAKRRDWDLHTLTSLEQLKIYCCEEMDSFPEADWQLPTCITQLSISELPNLKTIDASRLPPNLHTLWINDCPKVKFSSKLTSSQDLPASFVMLNITDCPVMAKQLETRNRDLIPRVSIRTKIHYPNNKGTSAI